MTDDEMQEIKDWKRDNCFTVKQAAEAIDVSYHTMSSVLYREVEKSVVMPKVRLWKALRENAGRNNSEG